MKEYMLIAVCMLAGKYVNIPIWLNIFFGISAAWAVRDESRLAVGNKEDKKMFEKEIDEIYGLCKRVVNEVPTANITFDFSGYGLDVRGLKRKEDVRLPKGVFKWDLYQNVSFNPFYEKKSRESLRIIKAFLLELLIDGKCPNE